MSSSASGESAKEIHQRNSQSWRGIASGWYTARLEKKIAHLQAGGSTLEPREIQLLNELSLTGAAVMHLQCADGSDLVSFARAGASDLWGLDIAPEMIAHAQRLTTATSTTAVNFVTGDVLDAPTELDGRFDVVFTGKGAVMWMHDLSGWANVIERLLKPGGQFVIFDLHPASGLFDQRASSLTPTMRSYFNALNETEGWPGEYGGGARSDLKSERLWSLASIVQAVIGTGLIIDTLEELNDCYYPAFPKLSHADRSTLPLTFLLMASKPN